MLCQECQQRDALVHLTNVVPDKEFGEDPGTERKQHFCEQCADAYFASTPGMNSMRGLICLSDSYRSKLYDLLEVVHPEAYNTSDTEACRRESRLMQDFLWEHLKKDNIEVNDDAFRMLCSDFFGSHHFYTRVDEYKRRRRQRISNKCCSDVGDPFMFIGR